MQFSRPSSAGPIRPISSSKNKILQSSATTPSLNNRPQTASSTRNISSNNHLDATWGQSAAGFDFTATHATSSTSFQPTKSMKSFTIQGNKLPHYVATDKQVLRFYCHYFEAPTQLTYQPIRNLQTASTVRYITLHYFLEDQTFEMFCDKVTNSGVQGGPFYRRDVIKKSAPGGNGGNSEELLRIEELSVGGTFSVLGRDFFVTDCDEFTREYFRYEKYPLPSLTFDVDVNLEYNWLLPFLALLYLIPTMVLLIRLAFKMLNTSPRPRKIRRKTMGPEVSITSLRGKNFRKLSSFLLALLVHV